MKNLEFGEVENPKIRLKDGSRITGNKIKRNGKIDIITKGVYTPCNSRIKIGNFIVAENGKISDSYDEKKLKEYMQWDSIEVEINLKLGNDAFKCFTCDFTHDYIDINADYRN